MEKEYKYMVATQCMTYNQSAYIEDTLRGFAMQKTTFPVVYVVVDDASVDGEQEVLKEWANRELQNVSNSSSWKNLPYGQLLVSALKESPQSVFVFLLLKENHYQSGRHQAKMEYISEWIGCSKYNALCEGDDFWIMPNKLQKQVDFLENHPDFVLCHTDFELTTGGYRNHGDLRLTDGNVFPSSITEGLGDIGTLTVLYRTDVYKRIPKLWVNRGWPMGDYQMWIEMSHEGCFKRLSDITAKYRILPQSASHGNFDKEVRFIEAIREVRLFYSNYYGIELPADGYSSQYYMGLMKVAFKHNRKYNARMTLEAARSKQMTNKKIWLFYFATIITPLGWVIRKLINR